MDVQQLPYPWECQPGETPKAYAAFQVYMKLPTRERSVQRAISEITGAKPGANGRIRRGWIEGWSTKYDWVERAAAWDQEVARRQQEAFWAANAEAAQRMATEAETIQASSLVAARAILEKISEVTDTSFDDLKKLPLADLVPMLRGSATAWAAGNRAERLARGMNVDERGEAPPAAPVRELAELEVDEDTAREFFATLQQAGWQPGDD